MTTYSKEWHYENCMGLDRCAHDDPECPHNHFLKGEKCHCPPLLNRKPVDDKAVEDIVRRLYRNGYSVAEAKEAVKALDHHYQKKYLGLLPKKYSEKSVRRFVARINDFDTELEREVELMPEDGWNAAISEAIANIGGGE